MTMTCPGQTLDISCGHDNVLGAMGSEHHANEVCGAAKVGEVHFIPCARDVTVDVVEIDLRDASVCWQVDGGVLITKGACAHLTELQRRQSVASLGGLHLDIVAGFATIVTLSATSEIFVVPQSVLTSISTPAQHDRLVEDPVHCGGITSHTVHLVPVCMAGVVGCHACGCAEDRRGHCTTITEDESN
jgi:hypothetical protein